MIHILYYRCNQEVKCLRLVYSESSSKSHLVSPVQRAKVSWGTKKKLMAAWRSNLSFRCFESAGLIQSSAEAAPPFVQSDDEGVGGVVHDSQTPCQLCTTTSSRMTSCVPTAGPAFFNETTHSWWALFVLSACIPNHPCSLCWAGRLFSQPHEVITGSFVIADCKDVGAERIRLFMTKSARGRSDTHAYTVSCPVPFLVQRKSIWQIAWLFV